MILVNFLKYIYKYRIFKRIVPSLLRKTKKKVIVKSYNFKISTSLKDSIDREIFLEGFYDRDRFNFLDKYFTNHNFDYFIDVGSYTGYYALYCYHYKKILNVFAFEPNIHNFNKLKENDLLNNSKINIYNFGCSDYEGEGQIWYNNINKTGGSSIHKPNDFEIKKYSLSKISTQNVKLKKLDSFFENLSNKLIFIKVDVERYEMNVLKGSINILKNNKILIQIESNLVLKGEVFNFLSKLNFIYISSIDDDHYLSNFIKT